MFGRPFNTARFNLGPPTLDIHFRVSFVEALQGSIGAGADLRVDHLSLAASWGGVSAGGPGVPLRLELLERLEGRPTASLGMQYAARFSAALRGAAELGADVRLTLALTEELASSAGHSLNIHASAALTDALEGGFEGSADLHGAAFLTGLLGCTVASGSLQELVVSILGALPPGSELRIDSENYEVLLDGQSVLHLQEGDWIELERALYGITIDSGSGGALEGEIIYTERYL